MNKDCNNRNCCCNNYDENTNAIETECENIGNYNYSCEDNHSCECGFNSEESVFPMNPMLAQSYVPVQTIGKTFTPCCGLENGTIFPELVSTYYPGQSMRQMEYLKNRNTIGEGCNSCS